ncbi:DUF3570 domain-containing protein [candidate division KSB1 bacterium]|nr:DUF3570 domain-containing protein [candidate division KSB1 bacterium]
MITKTHKIIRAALATLALGAVIFAAKVSFTDDSVSLRTNFFKDSGGLLVQSPTLQLVKDIAHNTVLSLQYTLDRVNIPPYRGISAKPVVTGIDGFTGASKPAGSDPNAIYIKKRNEIIASINSSSWNATAYYSSENDYIGRLIGFGVSQGFNQKNTNLSLGLSYGYDTINPLGQKTTYTRRNILVDAAITQTLSPAHIMRFGIDISRLNGFQSNPYRQVNVAGGYPFEQHPQQRLRIAGYVKLNTHLKPANAALWAEYRVYGDDWGILSHTLGLRFYQNLSKRLLMRYRYRFYTQSPANFWRKDYSLLPRQPEFFTDDYKLEPFNSHLFGFHLAYKLEALRRKLPLMEQTTLDVKYERFFTSNNFTANIFQIGLTFEY